MMTIIIIIIIVIIIIKMLYHIIIIIISIIMSLLSLYHYHNYKNHLYHNYHWYYLFIAWKSFVTNSQSVDDLMLHHRRKSEWSTEDLYQDVIPYRHACYLAHYGAMTYGRIPFTNVLKYRALISSLSTGGISFKTNSRVVSDLRRHDAAVTSFSVW